jgi:hypothetical protein
LSKKGVAIGLPREEKIDSKPGPGEYDFDSSMDLRANKASVIIGTAERKDIWANEKKVASENPGAGAYLPDTSSFNKTGTVYIGRKWEDKQELLPGPGEYDADSSMDLRANKASVRIGTASKPDIWESQTKKAM